MAPPRLNRPLVPLSDRRWPLAVVVLLGVSLRAAYALTYGPPPTDVYTWELATALLDTQTLAYAGAITTHYEPLHPAWLALTRLLTGDHPGGVIAVQIALAGVVTMLVSRLGTQVTGSTRAGLAAAALYAVSPYLIRQSAGWLEITLFNFLLVAGWLAWQRERRVLAVACLAAGALTRSFVLPIAAIAVVLTWRDDRRRGVMALCALVAVVGPWAVRNVAVGGTPWPTRHSQILYAGNNPRTAALVPAHDMDLFSAQVTTLIAPDERVRLVREYVVRLPGHFVVTKLRNLVHFFSPRLIPYLPMGPDSALVFQADGRIETRDPRVRSRAQTLAQEGFATVLLAAAAAGWFTRRRLWRRDGLLLLSVATFAVIAMAYYPTTRLRTGIEPILMVYAGSLFARRLSRASEEHS